MSERPTRGPATFRQRDLERAIRATEAAGKRVARIEVGRDGTIVIIPHENAEAESPADEWEGAKCR